MGGNNEQIAKKVAEILCFVMNLSYFCRNLFIHILC